MTDIITAESIVTQLNWRYGAKAFDPAHSIPEQDWNALKESLRLAPSSFGLQPWRFVLIETPTTRAALAEAAPLNRSKIESCSHLVVLARLKYVTAEYIDRHFDFVAAVRGVPRTNLQSFRDMIVGRLTTQTAEAQSNWTARQTYVAMGTFLTAAALLGIDACAMEGIDPAKFDEIAGLVGTDYATVAALAAGYRSGEDKTQFAKKVRLQESEVFVAA